MPQAVKNILAVDDEPKILEAVASFLESKGYQVDTAASGAQALEIFQKKNIALVLLDLMLPGLSGLDVTRTLKSRAKTSSIPIVMLTARGDEADVVAGLDMGADDFLAKPVSLPLLAASVVARAKRSRRLKRSHGEFHRLHKALRELEAQRMGNAGPDDVAERVFPEALSPTADSPADGGKA